MSIETTTPPKAPYVPPPECDFDYSQFVTEDETPLDSYYQEKQQRFLPFALRSSWTGPGNGLPWVVGANVGVFHTRKEPAIVPDVFVAVDVKPGTDYSKKENRSYFIWDMGKPPALVVEFVSNTEGNEDSDKLKLYGNIGVTFYVIFDPLGFLSDEMLRVYVNQRGKLVPTQERFFPEINLGVTVWNGVFEDVDAEWLRWIDVSGNVLLTSEEMLSTSRENEVIANGLFEQEKKRSADAEKRAEQEKVRADEERQQAEQYKLRAEKLAAQLLALGIDPH